MCSLDLSYQSVESILEHVDNVSLAVAPTSAPCTHAHNEPKRDRYEYCGDEDDFGDEHAASLPC